MFEYAHPILASFPLPLLVAAFLTELAAYLGATKGWRVYSGFIILLAAIFSYLAYYSGMHGAEDASKTFSVDTDLINRHQVLAKLYLVSMFPTTMFAILRMFKNNELLHWILIPFLVVSMLLSGLVAHKGGLLVFEHGAGVSAESSSPELDSIPENTPSADS